MPPLNEKIKLAEYLARVLIYGPGKVKKSWWAGAAAESGFNVIIVDGNNETQILKNLTPEARDRIQVIDVADTFSRAVFAEFMAKLFSGDRFAWDEQDKKIVVASPSINPNHSHYLFDLSKLTPNEVFVCDSYTDLEVSAKFRVANDLKIDLTDTQMVDNDKWSFFRYEGDFLTWCVSKIRSLKCHSILVCHEIIYEKYKGNGKDRTLEWSKKIIKSSSGPHAMQLPPKFADVLRFYKRGKSFKIESEGDFEKEGGCRNIPPATYTWDELQFKYITDELGCTPTGEPCEAVKWFAPGELTSVSEPKKALVGDAGAKEGAKIVTDLTAQRKAPLFKTAAN